MTEQAYSFKDFSVNPTDLLLPEDDDNEHDGWQDYCYEASKLDRQHILDAVLSSLDADDSPLYGIIDTCIKDPCEPGRARESLTVLAALGQAILDRVAASIDDAVGLRMAIGGAS
jgi:hypothetical protein